MSRLKTSQIIKARDLLVNFLDIDLISDVAALQDIDRQDLPNGRDKALQALLEHCNRSDQIESLLDTIVDRNPAARETVTEIIAMLRVALPPMWKSQAGAPPDVGLGAGQVQAAVDSSNSLRGLKGFAILVGCHKYFPGANGEGKLRDIPQVGNNITALKEFLLLKGLHNIHFADSDVKEVSNPESAKEIEDALDFINQSEVDVLIFYYGGHGRKIDGETYLSLANTPPNGFKGRSYRESLILDRFVGKNAASPAGRIQQKIFIYDCCRSGGDTPRELNDAVDVEHDEPPFSKEDLSSRKISGAAYLYACGPNGKAGVIDARDHTILVDEFLVVLKNGSHDLNEVLTVRSVLDETKTRVKGKRESLAGLGMYLDEPITQYFPKDGGRLPILAYSQTPKKASEIAIHEMIGRLIEARGGEFVVNAKEQIALTRRISDLIGSKADPGVRLAMDVASLDRIFDDASMGVTLIQLTTPKTRKFEFDRDLVPVYANKRSYKIHLGLVPEPRDPRKLLDPAYLSWMIHAKEFIDDQTRVINKLAVGEAAEPTEMMIFRDASPDLDPAKDLHVDETSQGRRFYPLTLSHTMIKETENEQIWLLLVGLLGAGRIGSFRKR